jgi:hypothetical protein
MVTEIGPCVGLKPIFWLSNASFAVQGWPRTMIGGKDPAHVLVDKRGMSKCAQGQAASRYAIHGDLELIHVISN